MAVALPPDKNSITGSAPYVEMQPLNPQSFFFKQISPTRQEFNWWSAPCCTGVSSRLALNLWASPYRRDKAESWRKRSQECRMLQHLVTHHATSIFWEQPEHNDFQNVQAACVLVWKTWGMLTREGTNWERCTVWVTCIGNTHCPGALPGSRLWT